MNVLKSFIRDESGQDMVEYGLLAAFISIVAIGSLVLIKPVISTMYSNIHTALTS